MCARVGPQCTTRLVTVRGRTVREKDPETQARSWTRAGDRDGSARERHPMPRTRPHLFALFTVLLASEATMEAVVLHSTPTADQATIAFHDARHRLIQNQTVGELVVVHHAEHARVLLREPLGTGAGT